MPTILNWLLRLVFTNPICMRLVQGGSRRPRHLYIRAGYLAVMGTDTAPFRYPHYHKASDTPDKIDFERFFLVVRGLEGAVQRLVNPQ